MTVSVDIRAALETTVLAVTGMPTQANCAFDGVPYEPKPGTDWADISVKTLTERPSSAGDSAFILHEGLLLVTLYGQSGKGAGALETLADAVRAAFRTGLTLGTGTTKVRTRYAEKAQPRVVSNWLQLPVTIQWYAYSQS